MAGLRRFIQINGELVEVEKDYTPIHDPKAPLIIKDCGEFRSPVDGTMILGHRTLREHNLRNNTTNVGDFKETWEKAGKERKARMEGTFESKSMRESLAREFERRSR